MPKVPNGLIAVVDDGAIADKVSLSGDKVPKVQEALLKVFDRILEVAGETKGIEVGDRVVCYRPVGVVDPGSGCVRERELDRKGA